jgi:predicted DNA-binding transcriptional regulator YafY
LRLWRLDRIQSVDVLDGTFNRDESFDLAAYAAQSFGVFQDEPRNVVLRFDAGVAEEAAGWLFHPSQTITEEVDGELTVQFRAGGLQEICWHLVFLEDDRYRPGAGGAASSARRHGRL